MKNQILIYGANGYTGKLIAQQFIKAGLTPILAGRSHKVLEIAQKLGLNSRVFSLAQPNEIINQLADIQVLINLAGPFAKTNLPLAQACIASQTHYLDIAGEVPEFEGLFQLNESAQQAGAMLMPGAGFGVVPTDAVAWYLKQQMPDAQQLSLAFATEGGVSQGTLRTVLKDLPKTGVKVQNTTFIPAKPAEKALAFKVANQNLLGVTNPWRADLFTAQLSTQIPNIETYSAFPAPLRFMMRNGLWFKWFLESNFLAKLINLLPEGPSEKELQKGKTYVFGRVQNLQNQSIKAILLGPEAYLFTALTAVEITRQILAGHFKAGFQTPSQVYGTEIIEKLGLKIEIQK
jgi:short subunit dehydrogenase-like uncharacterized protein